MYNTKTLIFVEGFLQANIALHKLRNPSIKTMFEKLGVTMPSESACHKVVTDLHETKLIQIRKELSGFDITVMCDEAVVKDTTNE